MAGHGPSAKKRIQFSGLGYVLPPPPPASVARRNARERNRVKQVNMGFAVLRQHIPTSFCNSSSSGNDGSGGRSSSSSSSSKSRKVSKVDTLRCAVEYIRSLQEMLDGEASGASSAGSTLSSENVMSPPSYTTKSFAYGHHPHHHGHLHPGAGVAAGSATSLSPSCSDASSPTPSYESEHSYFTASSWDAYDHYEAYDGPELADAVAPNEDELLDAISWWQQSQ